MHLLYLPKSPSCLSNHHLMWKVHSRQRPRFQMQYSVSFQARIKPTICIRVQGWASSIIVKPHRPHWISHSFYGIVAHVSNILTIVLMLNTSNFSNMSQFLALGILNKWSLFLSIKTYLFLRRCIMLLAKH